MMNNEDILTIVRKVDQQMEGYHQDTQDFLKERKIRISVMLFLETKGMYSDMQLERMLSEANKVYANIPVISRSSIDRYLKDPLVEQLYGKDIYRSILEKRLHNLLEAKSKGGKQFANNNIALKNENGEFIGSVPRK